MSPTVSTLLPTPPGLATLVEAATTTTVKRRPRPSRPPRAVTPGKVSHHHYLPESPVEVARVREARVSHLARGTMILLGATVQRGRTRQRNRSKGQEDGARVLSRQPACPRPRLLRERCLARTLGLIPADGTVRLARMVAMAKSERIRHGKEGGTSTLSIYPTAPRFHG